MSDLVKQISPSQIVFGPIVPTTSLDYSLENQFLLVDKYVRFGTSTSISKPTDNLNQRTLLGISKLYSFLELPENWDSYNAAKPSRNAIENAIDLIIRLAQRQQFPFFLAPSPNGDILVELKNNNVTLEFLFSDGGQNSIIGFVNDDE